MIGHKPAHRTSAGHAVGSWPRASSRDLPPIPPALERFHHIVEKITRLWGTSELDAYLKGLLLDTRDGQRRGFSLQEASAINGLIDRNHELIKIVPSDGGDPYNFNPFAARPGADPWGGVVRRSRHDK